jgi:hypothetical protein
MGMIEAKMVRVPEGESAAKTIERLRKDLNNYFSEHDNSCDGYDIRLVKPEDFDELWETQETYKKTPEIKEKYRGIASAGKLVYCEIDY